MGPMKLDLVLLTLITVIPFCRMDLIMNMIHAEHYPAERHIVQTRDGYILSVYRIPATNVSMQKMNRTILFMHGMTSAAPAFLTFGRNTSAAYKFSDAGYDVWIGNARGNTYSRRHVSLNPNDPRFWDFSWHEIGVYDIPATIDYILNYTNRTKLSYVGHSQGVTALFVTLTEVPEYNDKISVCHLMAPPVILKYNHPLFQRSMETVNSIAAWLRTNGFYEVMSHAPQNMGLFTLVSNFCMTPAGRNVCRSVVYVAFGPSNFYFDELFHVIINHIPAGASYKQFIHYAQLASSQKFQRYHYGIENNMRIYGTPQPPLYNLSNVRTNIHLMHGLNDWLTPSENIPLIARAIGPNLVAVSKFPGYNHIDFAYGSNLDMVHRKIFKVQNFINSREM